MFTLSDSSRRPYEAVDWTGLKAIVCLRNEPHSYRHYRSNRYANVDNYETEPVNTDRTHSDLETFT
jgi:hypothetical protein